MCSFLNFKGKKGKRPFLHFPVLKGFLKERHEEIMNVQNGHSLMKRK
jgi:hypothetical protein